jgi:oligopeptide transport system substrate-binding protein
VLNLPDDRDESLSMYQDDDLDRLLLWWLAPEKMEPARQKFAEEYISLPGNTSGSLVFNTSEPPLDDRRVRRALTMAFDKAQLPIGGLSFPATGGLIPPSIWGHSQGIGLRYDLERARSYLVEAGYPDGRGLPPITVLTPPEWTNAVEFPADRWRKDLGIEVNCEIMEWYDYQQTTWDHPLHHVKFQPWVADYPDPDNFMRVFMSLVSPWRNERYWELIEKARGIKNQEERISLYRRADQLLVEAAVVVPIMNLRTQLLVKPWVRNSWAPLFHNIWKDVVIEPHQGC